MFGKNEMSGKMKLANLLKTGEELHIFTFDKEQLDIFQQEARLYGMAYSLVKRSDEDKAAGTYTILCREKDVEHVLGNIRISDLPGADRSSVSEMVSDINEQPEAGKADISEIRKLINDMINDTMQPEYQSPEFEGFHEQETERS